MLRSSLGAAVRPAILAALLTSAALAQDPTGAADPRFTPIAPPCGISFCDPSLYCPGANSACRVASFEDTEWRVCITASRFGSPSSQHGKGFAVGPVWVRLRPAAYRKVLDSAGLAELFTAYHSGAPHFYDTESASWDNWRQAVTAADAGPDGRLLTLAQDSLPSVVEECRDRGPAWLCKGQLGSFVRRGQEMLLWGVYDAGNYDYITEYGFRDDGSISIRIGATGYNHPDKPEEAHMHDALWRLDFDLDGKYHDTARLTRHVEPKPGDPTGLQADDFEPLFNGGTEGFADWNPLEFTTLLIEDGATNAVGHPSGYELEPLRSGSARHYAQLAGGKERWSQHDFWVTRWRASEATAWAAFPPQGPVFNWLNPDDYLLPYIADQESIADRNLVVWYLSSAHHDPVDEDLDSQLGPGVTLTHWFGFELRPHDFFAGNPLGGPSPCD